MPRPFLPAVPLLAACALVLLPVPSAAQSAGDPTAGRALAGELGCGACHEGAPAPTAIRAAAPSLDAGLPAAFVFAYLADPVPRRTDIGRARMPDFGLDEAERVALTLYLAGEPDGGAFADARRRHPGVDATRGQRIFAALGCAGCHARAGAPRWRPGPDLSAEGARVREAWLRPWLRAPTRIRPRGVHPGSGSRMPDFRLGEDEAAHLAAWLQTLRPASARGGAPAPGPLTVHQARRAETFVTGRLACLGCHRIGGEGGEIGPPLDGVAERLHPGFVAAVLADPDRAAPGSAMPAQPMTAADRERVARWLLGRRGPWSPPPRRSLAEGPIVLPPAVEAAVAGGPHADGDAPPGQGRALYDRWCAACHGFTGRGDGWNAPNLPVAPTAHADAGLMARRPDDTLFDGIHGGGYVLDRSRRMPAFGAALGTEEIRALVAYIRTLCGCEAPAWSRDGRGGAAPAPAGGSDGPARRPGAAGG